MQGANKILLPCWVALYTSITDCKTARIGSVHLDVHQRALQNDLGLAACADVFVFKRCVCNKLFSEMFGSVSPCSFFTKKRCLGLVFFLFLCSVCVGARRSGMAGGMGWRRGARATGRIAGISEGWREWASPVAYICYRFPLRPGNEYSQRFIINCERKISGDG